MVHGLTDWIPNTYLSPFNSVDIRPEMLTLQTSPTISAIRKAEGNCDVVPSGKRTKRIDPLDRAQRGSIERR